MSGSMVGFTRAQVDSAGVFLIGQLEKLDPTIHKPLFSVTWGRDINLREDVTAAFTDASFTNSAFGAMGGINPQGVSWIGMETTTIQRVSLDIGKTKQPLTLWGQQAAWTIPELMSAQVLQQPIDTQKIEVINSKHQMDVDRIVYTGDTTIGYPGLLNNTTISTTNAVNGASGSPLWANKTPQEMMNDVTTLLTSAWTATGYTVTPDRVLIPPSNFALISNTLVSTAGSQSVLNYLRNNSISMTAHGRPLDIQPLKWLVGRGTSGVNRMVAYTKNPLFVRYPMTPLQRTPLEYEGIWQKLTYWCRLGMTEFIYPETVAYLDGI